MHCLVSIIIPTYNRAHLISETLDSILAQTYTNWECIIVDDHSQDNTQTVIKEYQDSDSRFQFFVRPNSKNKGANSCRNYGIEKSKGNYIIFLDSDDLFASNCLENRIATFDENQKYDMLIFSMGHFITKENCYVDQRRTLINLESEKTLIEFLFGSKLPWNITRPIYKRTIFDSKMGFNEKIQAFQDDEFHIRILGTLPIKYRSIDTTDCFYRMDDNSLNKYNNAKGFQNTLDSLYHYYFTAFTVLDDHAKNELKLSFVQKYFEQILFYLRPNLKLKSTNKTIKLFQIQLKLSIKHMIILYTIMCLNYFYYNQKGYYRTSRFLRKSL